MEQVKESFYDSGKLKEQLMLNEDGKPHGNCKRYFENGNLQLDLNYKNGKEHGKCNEFYEDGTKNIVGAYRNGEIHGERKQYYPSGKLENRANYIDGLMEGVCLYLSEDGEVIQEQIMLGGTDFTTQIMGLMLENDAHHMIKAGLIQDGPQDFKTGELSDKVYKYYKKLIKNKEHKSFENQKSNTDNFIVQDNHPTDFSDIPDYNTPRDIVKKKSEGLSSITKQPIKSEGEELSALSEKARQKKKAEDWDKIDLNTPSSFLTQILLFIFLIIMLWFGVFRTTDKETYINDTDKQIKTYNKEEIPKQSNQEKELLEEVRSDLRVNESEIFEKQRNQYIQEHLQKIFPNIDADSLAAEQRKRIIKEKGFITKEEELNIEKFRKALKKEIEEE